MKFKHFILSLLFLLTGWFAAAASDSLSYEALSDSLLQNVIRQFEVIHSYNTRNDELGRSDKNIYMITFRPGQEIYADAMNDLYFKVFNESPAGGHPSLVSANFKNEMNARLVEFNGMQPSQRRAVTMYGFILENYYLDVDSDFLRNNSFNTSLVNMWKDEIEASSDEKEKKIIEKNIAEYQTQIVGRVVQRLKEHLQNKSVLVHSIASWSSKKWASEGNANRRDKYVLTHSGWNSNSTFVTDNTEARQLYRSSMRSSRAYPAVCATVRERTIFHNIVSEIEFLTNPDIVAQFNRPCGEQLHIWRDHPMVSDPAHPYYARIQGNPCLLKTIILQTHIPTDEHSRFEAKGCHIVFKDSWLLDETAPRKQTEWESKVNEAKNQLTALIQGSNTYVYAPSMNEKSREVLNDKFITYNQYVPDKKIFFLHLSLPFFLTPEEKQLFANDVAAAPGFTAANMTLFVVPYFSHIYIRGGHCSSTENNVRPMYYYFPAVAGYDAAGIRAAMLPNDMVFNLETDYGIPLGDPGFYASCLNLYKRVNKPYVQVKCFIRRSGHVEMIADRPTFPLPSELTNNTYLTNLTLSREHKAIVDYRIYYDSIGIKHINNAHELRMAQFNACNNTPCLEQATDYYYESVRQIVATTFDVEASSLQFFTNPRLRESYALRQDPGTGLYYIDLYCRSLVKKWFPPGMPAPQAVDVSLDAAALFPYQWTQQDVYLIFDIASIALSPFGLDVIPEYLGFCYATLNLDESRMAIYGGAVLAVGGLNYAIHGASISARYGSKVSDNSISGTWRWISSAPDVTDALHLRWPQSQVRTLVGSSQVRLSRLKQLMRNDDLLRALDELPDDAVRRAFLEDFLRISPEGAFFAAKLLGKPRLVRAWGVAFRHSDELKTDITFLTKFSDDLHTPRFPEGANPIPTVQQLTTALDNSLIYGFYRKFANSPAIGLVMRQRYLEALTLPDAIQRIAILDALFDMKVALRNLNVLDEGLLENLAKSNLADGFATYTINGTSKRIDFISISGRGPSQTLISNLPVQANNYSYFQNKIMVPPAGDNATRFFKWLDVRRAQDSEAKIFELVLDRIATEKGIVIPTGADKSLFLNEVLNSTNLHVSIRSEMQPCSSCTNIISNFNTANSTPANVIGGVKYYE